MQALPDLRPIDAPHAAGGPAALAEEALAQARGAGESGEGASPFARLLAELPGEEASPVESQEAQRSETAMAALLAPPTAPSPESTAPLPASGAPAPGEAEPAREERLAPPVLRAAAPPAPAPVELAPRAGAEPRDEGRSAPAAPPADALAASASGGARLGEPPLAPSAPPSAGEAAATHRSPIPTGTTPVTPESRERGAAPDRARPAEGARRPEPAAAATPAAAAPRPGEPAVAAQSSPPARRPASEGGSGPRNAPRREASAPDPSPPSPAPASSASTPSTTPTPPLAHAAHTASVESAARSVETSRGEPLPAHITWLASRGGGTARVRLHPPELGEIQLAVRVHGDAVEVQIRAEGAGARFAVLESREHLVEALAARDLRMEGFQVHGGDPARGDAAHTGAGGSGGTGGFPGERNPAAGDGRGDGRSPGGRRHAASGPAGAASADPSRPIVHNRPVDIRV